MWWKNNVEVNGVAIDGKNKIAYFMEAKWSKHPLDKFVL